MKLWKKINDANAENPFKDFLGSIKTKGYVWSSLKTEGGWKDIAVKTFLTVNE